MAKLNNLKKNVLTEKGALKPIVRDSLTEYVVNTVKKAYPKTEVVENKKNMLVVEHYDTENEVIGYTRIEFTTSTMHPSTLAPKKSTKKSTEKETFEIE